MDNAAICPSPLPAICPSRLPARRPSVTERKRHSWQWWELLTRIEQPGTIMVRARATDLAGRTQPDSPEWNRLGYGNNAV
jgi:hypothetical protein